MLYLSCHYKRSFHQAFAFLPSNIDMIIKANNVHQEVPGRLHKGYWSDFRNVLPKRLE